MPRDGTRNRKGGSLRGGLRGQEILIIVILLIFGWKRLPDAARSLGRSARVFKSEVEEMRKDGKEGAADGTVQSQATDQSESRLPQQVTPPPAPYQPQQPSQAEQQPQAQEQPQFQQPNYQPPQPHTPDDPTRPVA